LKYETVLSPRNLFSSRKEVGNMFRKLLITVALTLLFPAIALADGFIIPIPPHDIRRVPPLSIKYHRVNVTIRDQVATTEVDQVFINDFHRDLEGTYIFPVPEGASISKFSMYVGGEEIQGRILDKDQARRIYEDIVRREQDPAILEYVGREMFKARVYPIPAHGEKRIGLQYSEVLKLDSGVCIYTYSLDTEKFSAKPIQDVSITIDLRSQTPIKTVYSPTHEITVNKQDDYHAEVTYVEEHTKPDRDLVLYYTVSEKEMGLNLLSYKAKGELGFFLAMLSPQVELTGKEVGKDLFFLLDTSGSMKGEKISQAKDALNFCLQSLNPDDRFNMVAFSTDLEILSEDILDAKAKEIRDAQNFLQGLTASGGTNIHDALQEALRQTNSASRPTMIIFLTDGLPTVGVKNTDKILEMARRSNEDRARIFVFGVGYDVNTHFLDRLSTENGAVSEYVRPEESIEVKVSRFYGKVANPILTALSLEFGSMASSEIYPVDLPDLFKGSQLIVLGRYKKAGSTAVVLRGHSSDREKRFTYEVDVRSEERNQFIPRLWATRKIGYLLDQIRLHGHNQELVDEIVELSMRYGIMTEYTSFLVDADIAVAREELYLEAGKLMADAFEKKTGAGAVSRAMDLGSLKSQAAAPANVYLDERGQVRKVTGVKSVGLKTFYLKQGVWTDNEYRQDQTVIEVKRFSDAYFQLIHHSVVMGRYLALGDQVIVSLRGGAVKIGEEGKESFSEADLRALL
jgi:Ca-activated chloride channel family protein